ncbi:flavin reductase family protein [Amycolatopsis sp. NPDC051903]|uniref:flavin reductase family protein n=1 Tax=Amycolatopsis sp. NPDC051903 TaxID=3363936 RepID=UPI0037A9D024
MVSRPGTRVGAEELRRTCGAWPTGVAVVTSVGADGAPVGLAVNSFTSLSLDPPLVLFCAALSSTTWPHIRATGRFLVQMLAADQRTAAQVFARSGGDKFAGLAWHWLDGLPALDGTSAVLKCSLEGVQPGGDHEIAVGRVEAAEAFGRRPLVFHDGGLHVLPSPEAAA